MPANQPTPLAYLPALWVVAMTIVWCIWGWQLPWLAPVWEFLPEYLPAFVHLPPMLAMIAMPTVAAVLLARRHRLCPPRVAIAAGLLFLGVLATWLTFLGITGKWLTALPILLSMVAMIPAQVGRRRSTPREDAPPAEAWLWIVAAIIAVLASMAPAVESDGLRYHLTAPQEWLRDGRMALIPYSANSNLPAMLGAAAAFGGDQESLGFRYQFLNAVHLLLLAVLTGELARRLYRSLLAADRRAAGAEQRYLFWSVALLTLSIPAINIVGTWPFSDVAATTYLMAAILASTTAFTGQRREVLRHALVGLFLGAAVATKLSILPLAAIAAVMVCLSAQRRWWLAFVVMTVAGLFVMAPWLIKNWHFHGNPVYPVGYSVFGGPEWSMGNDVFYKEKAAEKGMGHGPLAFLLSPWNATANWARFESQNPGMALLAFLPLTILGGIAAFARRWKLAACGLWLPSCAVLFLGLPVWFVTYQSVRFLVPQLALLCAIGPCLAIYLSRRFGTNATLLSTRIALLVAALAGLAWTSYYRVSIKPSLQAAVGSIGSYPYIANSFNSYGAIKWLEEVTEENEPVFYIGEHRGFYAFHYRPILSDWFDTPRILTAIRETETNEAMIDAWKDLGIRYVLLNQAELGLYEDLYFRPRFSEAEWQRFSDLRRWLLERVVHEDAPNILVISLAAESNQ